MFIIPAITTIKFSAFIVLELIPLNEFQSSAVNSSSCGEKDFNYTKPKPCITLIKVFRLIGVPSLTDWFIYFKGC